jgi:hypothetical protein
MEQHGSRNGQSYMQGRCELPGCNLAPIQGHPMCHGPHPHLRFLPAPPQVGSQLQRGPIPPPPQPLSPPPSYAVARRLFSFPPDEQRPHDQAGEECGYADCDRTPGSMSATGIAATSMRPGPRISAPLKDATDTHGWATHIVATPTPSEQHDSAARISSTTRLSLSSGIHSSEKALLASFRRACGYGKRGRGTQPHFVRHGDGPDI